MPVVGGRGGIMTTPRATAPTFPDVRADFPFVHRRPEQIYLDSAATSQPPSVVLDAQREFTETAHAAVHRGSSAATGSATSARSEEHTSELQSLMRISYAVFCLQKNKL